MVMNGKYLKFCTVVALFGMKVPSHILTEKLPVASLV
jgi:hypothetical protein